LTLLSAVSFSLPLFFYRGELTVKHWIYFISLLEKSHQTGSTMEERFFIHVKNNDLVAKCKEDFPELIFLDLSQHVT
jgi:hypothetical protein